MILIPFFFTYFTYILLLINLYFLEYSYFNFILQIFTNLR